MARGLRTFVLDPTTNPGRTNLFTLDRRLLVLDYAHNEAGMDGLVEILRGLRPPGREIWLAIGTAGIGPTRSSTGSRCAPPSAWTTSGDRGAAAVPARAAPGGRDRATPGGAARAGKRDVPVYGDEMRALRAMLKDSSPGDVVGYGARAARAGVPLVAGQGRQTPRAGRRPSAGPSCLGARHNRPEMRSCATPRAAWRMRAMAAPQHSAMESPIVVASNRAPCTSNAARRQTRRPSRVGGLVTVLGGVLERDDATLVAAAVTEGDREVAPRGRKLEGAEQRVRYVDIPEERYEGYYNGIANGLLWFAHHYLWDLPRNPSFGERTEHEWADYVEANRAFARVLAAESKQDPVFLIQDYHLTLVPRMLRELCRRRGSSISRTPRSPDGRTSHAARRDPLGDAPRDAGGRRRGVPGSSVGRELPPVGRGSRTSTSTSAPTAPTSTVARSRSARSPSRSARSRSGRRRR